MVSGDEQKKRPKTLSTKYFSVITALIMLGIFSLVSPDFFLFKILQFSILDFHFLNRYSQQIGQDQTGVVIQHQNTAIHPDILILGVDNKSLADFGSWPFPRYRHADILNAFTRIKDSTTRESAVFLDFFFIEPSSDTISDALFYESILENDRVFLETVLTPDPPPIFLENEFQQRYHQIFEKHRSITQIKGNWLSLPLYQGMEPPLKPFIHTMAGYGHANLIAHPDGKFRTVPVVARATELSEIWELDYFVHNYRDLFSSSTDLHRIAWFDKEGGQHEMRVFNEEGNFQFTDQDIAAVAEKIRENAPYYIHDASENERERFVVYHYIDYLLPSISLSLAAWHLDADLADISIVVGEYVSLPIESEVLQIPIDRQGGMLINFMGPRSSSDPSAEQVYPVRSYSAYARRAPALAYETWPETLALEKKILMVGAFSSGLADDELTTAVGQMYGIEIHANALNTILTKQFITDIPHSYRLILLAGLIFFIAFISTRTNTLVALIIICLAFIPALFFFAQFMFEEAKILIPIVHPIFAIIFTFLIIVLYRAFTEEREKKRLTAIFGQYVSTNIVDNLIETGTIPELGGMDKELTVCFTDIRGFTTLSENMSSQELVNHLNVYFSGMTDIIMEHQGTLDKYIGDGIMFFWGAPLPQSDHAFLACQAAIAQMQKLNELNSQWPEEYQIDIGIGINTGIVTVGNIGSSKRMDYTLMGDNVNLAARIEEMNKQYFGQRWIEAGKRVVGTGSKILISEYTYALVKDRVIARELDSIRVRGKNMAVTIYELIDII